VEEVVGVVDKMREELDCPLCNEKVFSGLGKGCKMCGMALEDDEMFCSKICEDKFGDINQNI